MINVGGKIKNWKIPNGKKKELTFMPIWSDKLSPRLAHCLKEMNITQLRHVCIPVIWYSPKESWTTLVLNQPNFGRKAYREFVEYLINHGLEPIYVEAGDDSEDSMTGRLMR